MEAVDDEGVAEEVDGTDEAVERGTVEEVEEKEEVDELRWEDGIPLPVSFALIASGGTVLAVDSRVGHINWADGSLVSLISTFVER